MKSNKKRRVELKKKRAAKRSMAEKAAVRLFRERAVRDYLAMGGLPVNHDLLAPYNSYGPPEFIVRGYYLDQPFSCANCDSEGIWTSAQQKWWYEVAKGSVYSIARLCRMCRRKERERRTRS